MILRVAFWTLALSLLVAVLATAIIAVIFLAAGIEVAGLRQVMLFCAIMCLFLSPFVLGPLVWMTFSYRALSARLRAVALTDPLTGVANRRAFFEHVDARLGASGSARRFSLLMIDVDRFKAINDRLGHETGDAALLRIATELGRSLAQAGPADAMLARIGGEEFAVFLDQEGWGTAKAVAEALCAGLRATPFEVGGQRIPLSVSIGVWSGWASEVDGPLAEADGATYRAKARGRDRWEAAVPSAILPDGARAPARAC